MELFEAGIVLNCLCGAGMNTDMVNVLFDDRGRVKIGHQPIRCQVCGAIYRYGERLKYQLVPLDLKGMKEEKRKRRHPKTSKTRHSPREAPIPYHEIQVPVES